MKYDEWKWTDDLITNQEVVDYQHQALFRIINDLVRACNMEEGDNELLVEVSLDELLKYTDFHFKEEETYLKLHKYPRLMAHQDQHKMFIGIIKEFKSKLVKNDFVVERLLKFMEKWLVEHISILDKEAMTFCQKKKNTLSL